MFFVGHPKTFPGPKTHILGLEYEKSGNQIPKLDIFENLETVWNLLTKILCRMEHTLFQTSSRGSEMKQNLFGKNQKHCNNAVIN